MKILNFTAKEVLSALLDKTKTQTIRPAWKTEKEWCDCGCQAGKPCLVCDNSYEERTQKPARFKVGDKVKLMWNQRSKYKWFCICGNVEITEVFKIEIRIVDYSSLTGKPFYKIGINPPSFNYTNEESIAKLDGFSSAEQMFDWFDHFYNLSQPKEFWCYRWKWI